MIWFFTRGDAQLDIEVRRTRSRDGFELVVDYPDGTESLERFTNARKLVKRTLSVQQRLIREGWTPCGPGMRYGVSVPRPLRQPPKRRRPMPRLWAYVHRQVAVRLAATFGL